MIKVLLAEDNPTTASFMRLQLEKAGFYVITAYDGQRALDYWNKEDYDVVITDWMMPNIDGVELLRFIRNSSRTQPLVFIHTSLNSDNARSYSKECGADEYFSKPTDPSRIIDAIHNFRNKKKAPPLVSAARPDVRTMKTDMRTAVSAPPLVSAPMMPPPFVAVCIAASTGGPATLTDMLIKMPKLTQAAVFVVLHGPSWMMESFASRLERSSAHHVVLGEHKMAVEPGVVYLAMGDYHMEITRNFSIELNQNPKENYVRPSADPLFRSVATAFGLYSVGVVLTGLGSDGMKGSQAIFQSNGKIIVQEPATAIAPPMPESVIKSGIACDIIPIDDMHLAIESQYKRTLLELQKRRTLSQNPSVSTN